MLTATEIIALMMAVSTSETLVNFYTATQRKSKET
jgi:hypothetical protein